MLSHRATTRFKKDLQKTISQGKDYGKFRTVLQLLLNQMSLDPKYEDHPLVGNFVGFRELHIRPDWLLIYKIDGEVLILERTGSHSELFGK